MMIPSNVSVSAFRMGAIIWAIGTPRGSPVFDAGRVIQRPSWFTWCRSSVISSIGRMPV
nr:hypothetical protein [Nisaea sediminum]